MPSRAFSVTPSLLSQGCPRSGSVAVGEPCCAETPEEKNDTQGTDLVWLGSRPSSRVSHTPAFHSFLLLTRIPLCGHIAGVLFCFVFILLLMEIQNVSSF